MFLVKEDNHITRRTLWVLLVGVFLISFSLLTFEISLTRVLSVVLSYHYVFVVISLALLGLGVGGIFVRLFRPQIPRGHSRFGSMPCYDEGYYAFEEQTGVSTNHWGGMGGYMGRGMTGGTY